MGWVNNGEAGDLRRHRTHHDVTVMFRERILKIMMIWLDLMCKILSVRILTQISATNRKVCCIASTVYVVGLVQDCSNSIANALELLQSCTEPSMCCSPNYIRC